MVIVAYADGGWGETQYENDKKNGKAFFCDANGRAIEREYINGE